MWTKNCFISLGVVFAAVLIFICSKSGPPQVSMVISFEGYTNYNSVPGALLSFRNEGKESVSANDFCVAYWTNSFGIQKDTLVRIINPAALIKPGETVTSIIPIPPCEGIWFTTHSFETLPSRKFLHSLLGRWMSKGNEDQVLGVRIGPRMTNFTSAISVNKTL